MDLRINHNYIEFQQVLNNSNFAQFLSDHLSQNNVSPSEISNLLNLFSSQLNIEHQDSIAINDNEDNNLQQSMISHHSYISNNHSIISNSNLLNDISEAPIVNNDAAPGLINFQKKEYENGAYEGTLINNKREGQGIMRYNSGDT